MSDKETRTKKPDEISATYIAYQRWIVKKIEEELHIDWRDIEEYEVRGMCLRVKMKDGKELYPVYSELPELEPVDPSMPENIYEDGLMI